MVVVAENGISKGTEIFGGESWRVLSIMLLFQCAQLAKGNWLLIIYDAWERLVVVGQSWLVARCVCSWM